MLRHLSFTLPETGLIAIRGRSGSGKSTLLNMLAGFLKPSEGEIFFRGKALGKMSKKEKEDYRAFSCGFIYQHFNLFEKQTALFNVMMTYLIQGVSKTKAKQKAKDLFSAFHMEDLEEKKVGVLSGGEKQRVAILRAIAGEPEILFADEPTGALDHENETLVMATLQEIAKTTLVLLVSHNARLIDAYAQEVIEIKDGAISKKEVDYGEEKKAIDKRKRGTSIGYVLSLFKENYRQDFSKHLLSFFASFIGFVALTLSLGFTSGSEKTLQAEKKRNLQYLSATLSKVTTYDIEGSPLKLSQRGRPEYAEAHELISEIPDVSLHPDYSYFFPSYGGYSLNGLPQEDVMFAPVFDITLRDRETSFSLEGKLPRNNDLKEAIVNRQFAAQFAESPLGKTITFARTCEVVTESIVDTVILSYSLYISAIVDEFAFLNLPKIYYSYAALSLEMKNVVLENLSKAKGREIDLDEYVNQAAGNSAVSAYGYLCFAHNELAGERLKNLSDELEASANEFSLSSSAYAAETSYSQLTSAFRDSLLPFLLIEIAGVAFIVASLSYASFLRNRRQAAILWALGARGDHTSLLYHLPSLTTSLAAAVLTLIASPFLSKVGSYLAFRVTGIENLIQIPLQSLFGVPYLLLAALPLFAIFLAYFGTGIPLYKSLHSNLAEELKDE